MKVAFFQLLASYILLSFPFSLFFFLFCFGIRALVAILLQGVEAEHGESRDSTSVERGVDESRDLVLLRSKSRDLTSWRV